MDGFVDPLSTKFSYQDTAKALDHMNRRKNSDKLIENLTAVNLFSKEAISRPYNKDWQPKTYVVASDSSSDAASYH